MAFTLLLATGDSRHSLMFIFFRCFGKDNTTKKNKDQPLSRDGRNYCFDDD